MIIFSFLFFLFFCSNLCAQEVHYEDRSSNISYQTVFGYDEFVYNAIDNRGQCYINENDVRRLKPTIRIPSHIITNQGTIIVACEVFFHEGEFHQSGVYVARSTNNGKEWEKRFLYKGGNPNIIYDRVNNRIFMLDGFNYYISEDEGNTWSEARKLIIRKPDGWDYMYQSPTTGIQLSNGVLATVYEVFKGRGKNINANSNVIVFSRDYGNTWNVSVITPDSIIANEATLAEYLPNQIMINARGGTEVSWNSPNPGRRIFVPLKKSSAKLKKWNIAGWSLHESDKSMIEPICNASFITFLKDNIRIGLFCNPFTKNNPRRDLMLQYSKDFKIWNKIGLLTKKDMEVYGYCSLYYNSLHMLKW